MAQLRVLTTDNWPLWRDARLTALREAPHAFKSRLADWHHGGEQRWRARLAMPEAHNLLATQDGRAVGTASGLPGDAYELRSVWVSSRMRGRGIATQLIAAVETWARQSGATSLKLAVIPHNEPAIALYQRHGFVVTDELGDVLSDGVTRESVMVKALRREPTAPHRS